MASPFDKTGNWDSDTRTPLPEVTQLVWAYFSLLNASFPSFLTLGGVSHASYLAFSVSSVGGDVNENNNYIY